jgi:hypothetical protein
LLLLVGGTKSLVLRPLLAYCTSPMIGEGDCGAIGAMKIGKGNRSTRRKPATAPLCPAQIPLDQTRGGKPATNRLSYGAAKEYVRIFCDNEHVLPSVGSSA